MRLTSFGPLVFQRAAFDLGQATPHAGVLAGAECPVQARVDDVALCADPFGGFDLLQGWAGGSYREEQFRVLISAGTVE
jgi:hypothetical protein